MSKAVQNTCGDFIKRALFDQPAFDLAPYLQAETEEPGAILIIEDFSPADRGRSGSMVEKRGDRAQFRDYRDQLR
jgi:hypothetical protein